jgi:Secretion system C-terminal sorting domain
MRKIYLGMLCMLQLWFSFAQKHDNIWLAGYYDNVNEPGYGNASFDFQSNTAGQIGMDSYGANFESTLATMCDSSGALLFYTNGCAVFGRNKNILLNGEGLNPGDIRNRTCPQYGYIAPKGAMALPYPGHPNKYILLHTGIKEHPKLKILWSPLYFTAIEMTPDGESGSVMSKNTVLAEGSLEPISATKHANGRDWWIVVPQFGSNAYLIWLLSPRGLERQADQNIGPSYTEAACKWRGTNAFSPDGTRYARFNGSCGSTFLDFDRCSGKFSNPKQIAWYYSLFGGGGVAFSPNSRFCYLSSFNTLFRVDFEQSTMRLDSIFGVPNGWGIQLHTMQLAPDGNIYVASMNSEPYYHIITSPDSEEKVVFNQKGLLLPFYSARTIPNFPNFRLGPLKGSTCDTLKTSTAEINRSVTLKVSPSPAREQISIEVFGLNSEMELVIVNIAGEIVQKYTMPDYAYLATLDISKLASGVYGVQLRQRNKVLAVEKLVVVR